MTVSNPKWKINVSQCLDIGSRSYMEDVCYSHIERNNGKALFGIFGIFDGHGGAEAACFVEKTFKNELLKIDKFWSDDNSEVLESIKLVYSKIQKLLWIERESWPKSFNGDKSTAGTTATIAVIRNGILYTGHVGDSAIVMAYKNEDKVLHCKELTTDHKPGNPLEKKRIEESGGSLQTKANIDRVVWYRRKLNHGMNDVEEIPFLAVARSLGDLWSYDNKTDCYHVSPEPDVNFVNLNRNVHRAVILGSDGLWNTITPEMSTKLLTLCFHMNRNGNLYNPAQLLMNYCLHLWKKKKSITDNVSVIVILIKPEDELNSVESFEMDTELLTLHRELMTNNLLKDCAVNETSVLLDNFADFQTNMVKYGYFDHDFELVKSYIACQANLLKSCSNWWGLDNYWHAFMKSIANIGLRSFTNLINYFETSNQITLENMLVSFPWSVCCLEIIDSLTVNSKTKKYLEKQGLLTPFWSTFHTLMLKNVKLSENRLSNSSTVDTMKNVLISKSHDINEWIVRISSPNSEFTVSNDLLISGVNIKLQMKKSRTCIDSISINQALNIETGRASSSDSFTPMNLYKCFQVKRSASFDITDSQFHYKPSVFNSTSTTPLNGSTDCDMPISPVKSKNVPYSLKRKLSGNINQLLLLPSVETITDPTTENVKKFALSRAKRMIL